jgi:uncharacterized protein YjbI with pentapeptide repeats
VYNPADKRAQPADLKRVYAEAEHFIESLDENIRDTAAEELKCIVEHIQNELHRRGTNLSSDYAEVGFSFNRENGTIDYLDGRKFIPLIDRTITPAPDGILIAEGVSLTGRDLSGAQLKGMILNELELGGVVLSDANLQGAQLLYTILSGADLSNADLSGANLTYADLQGAKLTGANLSEANLDNAVLTGVVFDETTRWPADFQVPGSS